MRTLSEKRLDAWFRYQDQRLDPEWRKKQNEKSRKMRLNRKLRGASDERVRVNMEMPK